jgi:hypothetical protein
MLLRLSPDNVALASAVQYEWFAYTLMGRAILRGPFLA